MKTQARQGTRENSRKEEGDAERLLATGKGTERVKVKQSRGYIRMGIRIYRVFFGVARGSLPSFFADFSLFFLLSSSVNLHLFLPTAIDFHPFKITTCIDISLFFSPSSLLFSFFTFFQLLSLLVPSLYLSLSFRRCHDIDRPHVLAFPRTIIARKQTECCANEITF